MADRGYTLIDFTEPSGLWPDLDRVVRFSEHVRTNFHEIVDGVPTECEVDLFTGGHAHNPGRLLPLLGVWAPSEALHRMPPPFRMIEEVTAWCSQLSPREVDDIVTTTAAPTWDELVRIGIHPPRTH